jgi:hypothetical protein
MGPTLDTGGRLTLTRPGLSPGKRRRASLGAITIKLSRPRCVELSDELRRVCAARLERFVSRLAIGIALLTSHNLGEFLPIIQVRLTLQNAPERQLFVRLHDAGNDDFPLF